MIEIVFLNVVVEDALKLAANINPPILGCIEVLF